MQQPASAQTELNLTRKYAKNHSFVPADHLTAVLTSGLHTKATIAELLGVTVPAINNWLRHNAMPKGFSLLCERLLNGANAEPTPINHLFIVSVPQDDLSSFKTILFTLNLPHQKLSL